MAAKLELRHLWGAPQDWLFDGEDESALRHLLVDLDEFNTDPETVTAVLVATEEDGSIIGAWTRARATSLARTIVASPPTSDPVWLELYGTFDDAVTGP
jgi:hypothetical protein